MADEHRDLGARFTDFAGWRMPLRFGSELDEHHAVRRAVGVFDLSHMAEIAVSGPHAADLLDATVVGRPSTLAVGRARYTLVCDERGGIVDDLVVYRLADDDFLLVANASNRTAVLAALRAAHTAVGPGTDVTDRTAQTALVAVQGPLAQEVVAALAPDAAGLKYFRCAPATVGGLGVLASRTGYTGEDGFELYAPAGDAVPLWRTVLTAVRHRGGLPAGLAARDTLRLEAGLLLHGNDISVHTDPYSAGLGRLVRLDGPARFPGRAALAELAGTPPQRVLVGLTGGGRRAARPGCAVHLPDGDGTGGTGGTDGDGTGGTDDAGPVGTVTSGALSPTLGRPVALAYVDAALSTPGTALTVDVRGHRLPFTVVTPPFYRRD